VDRIYAAIDLKSFYASVECVERGLDALDTNLVVADEERTEKTICLAVSPALKAYGLPSRARLFEVVQRTNGVNNQRRQRTHGKAFEGESYSAAELEKNPMLKLSYIVAPPRMALYSKYSTDIYAIYLKYVAPEDIHVYSIDEVFMDITDYLKTAGMNAREFTMTIIDDVMKTTGITATAGIGSNMYLSKVAMDIMAKKMKPDRNGVRIACLDEMTYRRELWNHTPLTDFWRIGRGYLKKLEENRLFTMGDIARCSLSKSGEDKLYKLFGINAELLIDHAWGWEPCSIADVKAYKPQNSSMSTGQVLQAPYGYEKAKLIVKEMTELLVLDLVEKELVTNQMILTVGYDVENLLNPEIFRSYKGEVTTDYYGRKVPKHAHGTVNLKKYTSSTKRITEAVSELYDKIVSKKLLVRRITLCANRVVKEDDAVNGGFEQLNLFTDYELAERERKAEEANLEKEKSMQKAMIEIKKRFGKNAVLKGMNLEEGATTIQRNGQIGGHKA